MGPGIGMSIGDGAAWRRLFGEWFPDAVQIVDFFHAAKYLWAAAGARYGPGTDLAQTVGKAAVAAAKDGPRRPGGGGAAQAGGDECGKAARHVRELRGRMRYDDHLDYGWAIGWGRGEAACGTVVGRRLKCVGMRWTVDVADPVPWVRCARLSGWFDGYRDERIGQAA